MIFTFIIYLGILFSSIFFVWIAELSKNKILRKFSIFLSFFIIILISCFRGSTVGVDNFEYSEWFRLLNNENSLIETISLNIIDFEPGFVFINYVLKHLNLNYNFALAFYAILIWVPIFIFLNTLKIFILQFFLF